MFRSHLIKIFPIEQSYSKVFWKNSQKYIYTNSCHCIRASHSSLKAKEATLTSNISHEKWEKSEDREFLKRLTNRDTFGTQTEPEYFDEGDLKEEKYISEIPLASQKLSTKQYADIIKSLISKRKIKEAIDVLENRMLKEDRVKPEAYIYNLLLGACGRVGYTKKAFMLYNDMKRRGLPVMGGTYTALFNACANSPWPLTDGLTRVKHLYDIMIEKGHIPNDTTYHSMIKAFGRCGDTAIAFSLVDEMIAKKIPVKSDTITFLLQTCVSDKEAGFRHALLVWRKLVDRKIKPSIFNFNTLLRCIRDCGMGDIETTQDVINKILSSSSGEQLVLNTEDNSLVLSNNRNNDAQETKLLLEPNLSEENVNIISKDITERITEQTQAKQSENQDKNLQKKVISSFKPNLIAPVPYLGSLISLAEIKKPEDRLLLVGGFKGLLENMDQHKCKPNIKTFTQLLDCIPGSLTAEQELLSLLPKYDLKPDIDFYNMLMKKRSLRCDYEGAKVRNILFNQYNQ